MQVVGPANGLKEAVATTRPRYMVLGFQLMSPQAPAWKDASSAAATSASAPAPGAACGNSRACGLGDSELDQPDRLARAVVQVVHGLLHARQTRGGVTGVHAGFLAQVADGDMEQQ